MIKNKLIIMIILVFLINIFNVNALTLLSPLDKNYETNENVDHLKINIDYINPYDETWIIINNQKIDLRKNNLIERFNLPELIEIENSFINYELDDISNYIEYSFSILVTGRGKAYINFSSNEQSFGIKYLNDWQNEKWQCYHNNEYINVGDAFRNTNYDFLIKVFNDGLYYDYYEIWINNEKKAICDIQNKISYIDNLNIKVEATTARLNNQTFKSGSYNIELPPGKHTATLYALDGDNEYNVKNDFFVIIQGCGNLICEGNKNYINCPADCKPFECDDLALIGDTNNDGVINEIDKTNLINILEGRIPYPERDCCVDLTGDKRITYKDLEIIDDIISGKRPTERCFTGCKDGTLDQTCSRTKPYFCDYGTLFENCQTCGCLDNHICMDDGSCFNLEDCRCSDVAAPPNNELGYDNIVDDYDKIAIEQHFGLCEGDERYNEKYDLNYDGCIDRKDLECINYNFNKRTFCAGLQVCKDGTLPYQCSKNLPMFCDDDQLIFKCNECGCPKYMECQTDGTCRGLNNFEIIIFEKGSNETKRYMEGGKIYVPLYKDSSTEIEFIINPLRDLQNMSFRLDLKKDKINFNNLNQINTQISRKINLQQNNHETILINLDDINNPLGLYEGNIYILINGYSFFSIPLELEIKEYVEPIIIKEIDYTKFIPYISSLILMFIILIYLLFRRRKERKLLRRLELDNNLILR